MKTIKCISKKVVFALLLALCFSLLTGCGGSVKSDETKTGDTVTESITTAQKDTTKETTAPTVESIKGSETTSLPQSSEDDYTFNIYKVDSELQLEDEWALPPENAEDVIKLYPEFKPVPDLNVCSAKIWGLFDDRYIYLYADVKDSTPLMNYLTKNDLYMADCIEISFALGPKPALFRKYLFAVNTESGENMSSTRPFRTDYMDPQGTQFSFVKNQDNSGYIFKVKLDTQNEELNFIKLDEMEDVFFDLWVDDSETGKSLDRNVAWKAVINKREQHGKIAFIKK